MRRAIRIILWALALLAVVGGIIAMGRPSLELCGGAILVVCISLLALTATRGRQRGSA